jgi:hypothetical protein
VWDKALVPRGEAMNELSIAIAAAAGWHTTVIIGRTGSPPIEEDRQL